METCVLHAENSCTVMVATRHEDYGVAKATAQSSAAANRYFLFPDKTFLPVKSREMMLKRFEALLH